MLFNDELKDFKSATATAAANSLLKDLGFKTLNEIIINVEKAVKEKTTEMSDRLRIQLIRLSICFMV